MTSKQQQNLMKKFIKLEKQDSLISQQGALLAGKQHKLQKTKLILWIVIIVGFLSWLIILGIKVDMKWKYMIQNINKARSQGSQFDKSGFIVALALEYPFLSALRIANPHLPKAIQLAYYSADTTKTMGIGIDKNHDYLFELDNNSQKCSPTSSGWCSSEAIWCSVFGKDSHGHPIEGCFPACNDPYYGNQALNYTSKIVGWGMNIGFAGHLGSTAFGGNSAFGIGGMVIGAGIGIWQAYNEHQQQVQKCKISRQSCYVPPGTKSC